MGGLTGLASLADTAITSTYWRKVVYYRPIAYWPLWETGGTSARCLINPAQNGTYGGPTLGQTVTDSAGVSFLCPFFDGTNDYVNVQTAVFASALNGSEGTAAVWCRVNAAAVWTDGSQRWALYTVDVADYNEYISMIKSGSNQIRWRYNAGGTLEAVQNNAFSSTNWFHMAVTWSASADQMKAYINGAQEGATQTVLGVWAGGVDTSIIGAQAAGPVTPWHGWLAHAAFWDRALAQADIADLATV